MKGSASASTRAVSQPGSSRVLVILSVEPDGGGGDLGAQFGEAIAFFGRGGDHAREGGGAFGDLFEGGRDLKGKLSPFIYLAGIGAAFYSTAVSDLLYLFVAILWLVPDTRIEKSVRRGGPPQA